MMKRSELYLSAIKLPVDYLMLFLAGLTAYYIRFADLVSGLKPVVYQLERLEFSKILAWVVLIWLVFFILAGLYKIGGQRKASSELGKIFLACTASLVTVIIWFFFNRSLFSSRFIILFGWGLGLVYVAGARMIIRLVQKYLFARGIGIHRVVIIGSNQPASQIIKEITRNSQHGYQVIGQIKNVSGTAWEQLDAWNQNQGIDEVMLLASDLDKVSLNQLLDYCNYHHIVFKYTADLFQVSSTYLGFTTLAGVPLVEIIKTPLAGWGRIYKRVFDIVGSLFLIILTSPIMLLTAVAIKLDSRGPVFFSRYDDGRKLKRIGEQARPFNYFKFRSMRPQVHDWKYTKLAELNLRKDSPLTKIKNDPRVTKVGRFIRRFSLDELPELFLVFLGRMSLVGPRPHEPEEVAKYQKHHRRVLTVKPGITGLAQVSGRSDLDFEEEVKLDSFYIENWSFLHDLQILLRTPLAVVYRRQAA